MSRRRSRVVEKRKNRSKCERQARHRRRENFDRVLRLMGLEDRKGRFGEQFLQVLERLFPKPRVVPAPSRPSDDLAAKAKELGRSLEKVGIRIDNENLSHDDLFTVCVGLHYTFQLWLTAPAAPEDRRELEHVLARLTRFAERYEPEVMAELEFAIRQFLVRHSRLDGYIYTAKLQSSFVGRRFICTTTLARAKPDTLVIEVGGVRRRAFRCGAVDDPRSGEITWTGWDAEVLGPGTIGRVPVYIQSHAIEQAYKRLRLNASDLSLHYFLAESLAAPRVVPGRDGNLLVEVAFGENRVGYLVAERIEGKVLVKTFLLITMRGTPEGERLHRRLRMSRADLEYLGLDNFAKLARTDLLRDEEIAGIFRECGCQGLLALARGHDWGGVITGFASEFRSYFGRGLDPILRDERRLSPPAFGEASRTEAGTR